MAVFNIRGTFGSGKSQLVRDLLAGQTLRSQQRDKGSPRWQYVKEWDLIIVGSGYDNPAITAPGADRIQPFDEIEPVMYANARVPGRHLLLEGAIVSTVYGRFHNMAETLEPEGIHFYFLYLTTPLEICLERISKRNGGKPFNASNCEDKLMAVRRQSEKARADGHRVVELDWERPLVQLQRIMREEGLPL